MLCKRFPMLICHCILILCILQAGTEKPCVFFWISVLNATMRLPLIINRKPPLFGSNHAPFLIS